MDLRNGKRISHQITRKQCCACLVKKQCFLMTCCPTAFCRNCAIEWFKINVTCPICKKCSKSFAEENSLLVQKIEIKEINYTESGNLFDNELYTIEDMHNS